MGVPGYAAPPSVARDTASCRRAAVGMRVDAALVRRDGTRVGRGHTPSHREMDAPGIPASGGEIAEASPTRKHHANRARALTASVTQTEEKEIP